MDNLSKTHILVTGGGAPGAAGIIGALKGKFKVSSCDQNPRVIGSELADDFFTVPHGSNSNYLSVLKEKLKEKKVDLILPITTAELIPLSTQKEAWKAEGIDLVISTQNSLDIANNKGKLYNHLSHAGLSLPNYRIVHDLKSFDQALDQLHVDDKALIFKPCVANGSRGFRIIDNKVNSYDLWLNQKPNAAYLSRQQSLDLLSKGPFVPLLVSDYLEGDEYSVDCMIQDERVELIIPRKRVKINNGISVEGIIEKNEEVIEYCKQVLKRLNLNGPIGIQLKYSKGKPYLLEINPRLQGTSVACLGAGINLPLLSAHIGLGSSIDWEAQRKKIKWGTHFYRMYQEVFSD